MTIIYEPAGKAREYSPLAANLYNGCNHGCRYCYVPRIKQIGATEFLNVAPMSDIKNKITQSLKHRISAQVLLSFTGDPYNEAEPVHRLTRHFLTEARWKAPIAILTKAGTKALVDIDIMKQYGDHLKLGATLTFYNPGISAIWEKNAALPADRIEMLKQAKAEGIKTWGSFEPVIEPLESIRLIKETLPFVDVYKIGKINNYKDIDKGINWTAFLREVVSIMRSNGKSFYVKHDLRLAAPSVDLQDCEKNHDLFNLPVWEDSNQSNEAYSEAQGSLF